MDLIDFVTVDENIINTFHDLEDDLILHDYLHHINTYIRVLEQSMAGRGIQSKIPFMHIEGMCLGPRQHEYNR